MKDLVIRIKNVPDGYSVNEIIAYPTENDVNTIYDGKCMQFELLHRPTDEEIDDEIEKILLRGTFGAKTLSRYIAKWIRSQIFGEEETK